DDVAAKRRKSIDSSVIHVMRSYAHARGKFLRGSDTIGQLLQVGVDGAGLGKVGGKPRGDRQFLFEGNVPGQLVCQQRQRGKHDGGNDQQAAEQAQQIQQRMGLAYIDALGRLGIVVLHSKPRQTRSAL